MKKKIASALFIVSFAVTGCGIESIFQGHAIEWGFAFLVTLACLLVIGG